MSGAESPPDEFGQIARLFRPLTRGAPEALDLLDDAAVIPSRPGFDLVVTKDALVAGVHFQPGEPPGRTASGCCAPISRTSRPRAPSLTAIS